ncbi:MAG: vitamin K epoxide reductase family protein [Patescibacteria group bacterium]
MAREIKYEIHEATYLLRFIMVVAVIGFAISMYSFLHHHAFASGTVCTINETFNCDIVNRGPFSEIFGIPVSLIGVIGYFFLGAIAFVKHRHPEDQPLSLMLVVLSTLAFLFSLYLTFIEAFILNTWCLLCVASLLCILLITVASFWHRHEVDRHTFLHIKQKEYRDYN